MGAGVSIPPRVRTILERWAAGDLGALTNFTGALVRNDLAGAIASADGASQATLPAIVAWMQEELPPECWGSPEAARAWAARHRRHDWWREGAAVVCDLCGSEQTAAIAAAPCPGPAARVGR